MNKKIILVDIDGVLADFEMGFIKAWGKKFPTHPKVPLEGRKAFRLAESYPNGLEKEIQSILSAPGFFENLNTIPGGKEALKKMQDLGHEVLICTSPISNYKNCVPEKYRWVAINLGFEWTKRIIMIKASNLCRAGGGRNTPFPFRHSKYTNTKNYSRVPQLFPNSEPNM